MAIRYLSGINVDSNTLFVDDVNNRVGIGTGSPARKLDVNGTSIFRDFTTVVSSNGNPVSNTTWLSTDSGITNIYTGGNSTVQLNSNGVSYFNGGNVGIGTTSPLVKLHVDGTGTQYIRVSSSDNATFQQIGAQSGGTFVEYKTLYRFVDTDAGERMRITSAGNVGIGTTSPTNKLQVTGGRTYLETGNEIYTLGISRSGANAYYLGVSNSSSPDLYFSNNAGTTRVTLTDAGNVGIGTTSPQSKLQIGTTNFSIADRTSAVYGAAASETIFTVGISGVDYPQLLNFGVNQVGLYSTISARQFTVATENKLVLQPNGGNVGIGTASPAYTLDVSGTARTTTGTYLGTSSGNVIVGGTTSDLIGGFKFIAIGNTAIQYAASTGTYLRIEPGAADTQVALKADARSGAYPPMAFHTSDTERMRITSAGNVGIGTTAPPSHLSVVGNIESIITVSTATVNYLKLGTYYAGQWGSYVGAGSNYSSTLDTDLRLGVSSGGTATEVIRITSSGNVGIGTTSPVEKLDVRGGAYINGGTNDNAYDATLYVTANSSNDWGIFVSKPSHDYGIISQVANGSDFGFSVYDGTTHNFRVKGNGTTLIQGNVGIGTTSPSYKASVVAANGNYWNGTAFTGTTLAISIENSEPGGYDPVLIYNQADSGGTLKNSGAIGMVGTGPWTAGNNALQVSDMYFLVRNSSGSISERLRIKSTGAAQLKAYGSGSFTGTVAYNLAVDSSGNIIETAGGVVDGSGTANYVSKWSDANTLTDSQLFDNGTNVGIGTASLGSWAKLQVNGNFAVTGTLFSFSNDLVGGSTPAYLDYNYSSGKLIIGSYGPSASGYIVLETGGTEKARITATGNVGIGTTAPQDKLTVKGATNYNLNLGLLGGYSGIYVYNDASSAYNHLRIDASPLLLNSYSGSNVAIAAGSAITRLTIGAYSGARLPYINGTANTFDANGITVTSSNTANAAIGGGIDLTNNVHSVGSFSPLISFSALSQSGTYNNNYAAIYGILAGDSGDGNWNSGHLVFATALAYGASEKMRITNAGNVGIGTTSPANKLVAVADATFNGENSYAIAAASSTDVAYKTVVGYDYANDVGVISAVRTGIQWKNLSILPVGNTNLGVGTLSPSQRLHVSGNLRVTGAYYDSNNSAGSSGQVLSSTGSGTDWVSLSEITGVDGTGTANYIAKWSDTDTITNSSITDNGTTVTATATNFVSQSNLGTAYTSFTTSGTTAIFDTITRTNSAIYQIVIVANPNSAGSGSYADFYYGKVFIGTGYNGSAVVDVINYHQESPMPRGLYGSGGGDLTVTAVMLVGGSEVTEVAVNTSYTIRIKIAGYNVAGSNTTVRLQRIM